MSKMGKGALAILIPLYGDVVHAGAIDSARRLVQDTRLSTLHSYVRCLLVTRCCSMVDVVVRSL